jgi:hypothetical protein
MMLKSSIYTLKKESFKLNLVSMKKLDNSMKELILKTKYCLDLTTFTLILNSMRMK